MELKREAVHLDGAGKHRCTAPSRSTLLTATPKTIDITITDGPGKDNTLKGIYELDGDTQKICWAHAREEPDRPAFEAKPESGRILQVLEKVKP